LRRGAAPQKQAQVKPKPAVRECVQRVKSLCFGARRRTELADRWSERLVAAGQAEIAGREHN